jgi:integrase/recombinase XerD
VISVVCLISIACDGLTSHISTHFSVFWQESLNQILGGIIMLESYFKSQTYIAALRKAPFGEYIDGFSLELERLGYVRRYVRRILWKIGHFNEFARQAGIRGPAQIDEKLTSRFIKRTATSKHMIAELLRANKHFLKYLRQQGLNETPILQHNGGEFGTILSRYDAHLLDIRGLSSGTRESYLRGARRLHDWLKNTHENRPIEELTGADVLDFVSKHVRLHPSISWRHYIGGATRAYLRFLHWEGIVIVDLARIVPSIPCMRLGSIPRHLNWDQVRKIIASVKTDSAIGKRDKAILLLLAMLGLRNQEIRKLRLNDIDWRSGKIHLLKTKSQRERILPLTKEVGDSLVDYLLHGRPQSKLPNVFLRHLTPVGVIISTHGVGNIVGKYLKVAGIRSPSYGSHVLRHSLATHMVNRNVPIKHIADMLGHASIDTTAIYTKVNQTQLWAVARAFPGETS